MEFIDVIKNKRVVFVGPAVTLQNTNSKSFIDSFEVVVKANGFVFYEPELVNDYSDRCDVIYFNKQFVNTTKLSPDKIRKRGIKFVCLKVADYINVDEWNRVIPTRFISKMYYRFTNSPLMGSLILNDLLHHKPRSIHLMGMDFYTNDVPYVKKYQPKEVNLLVKTNWKKYEGNFKEKSDTTKLVHNIKDDFAYIYHQYNTTKIITVDNYILDLITKYEE